MKPFSEAWEAEDGTLHKTREEADRHEQKARLNASLDAWGKRCGADIGTMMQIVSGTLTRFLYDQGVRFPAPTEPTAEHVELRAKTLYRQWKPDGRWEDSTEHIREGFRKQARQDLIRVPVSVPAGEVE